MSNIIPGYEYHIFISYTQKDNIHHGLATALIGNMKEDLPEKKAVFI